MNDIEEYIKRLEKRIKDTEDYDTNQVWLTDDVYAVKKVINRVKELEEELERQINTRIINEEFIENNFISKNKIKEILGIEEQDKIDILDYLEIIIDEFNRLEDIEDKKVQIEYEKVFNKGVKSVENKIKEKIEELKKNKDFDEDVYAEEFAVDILQELLEEEE